MHQLLVMIKTEESLLEIIQKGQSGIYDKNASLIRYFAGSIRTVVELGNPLAAASLVYEIDKFLEIMNPLFVDETEWFVEAKKALKLWHNDVLISNRTLGIKNDNQYDTRVFERVVREKFLLKENPKPDAIIETNFETMVELVELGARRFSR